MNNLLGTLVIQVIKRYCYYQNLNLKKHLQQEHSLLVVLRNEMVFPETYVQFQILTVLKLN